MYIIVKKYLPETQESRKGETKPKRNHFKIIVLNLKNNKNFISEYIWKYILIVVLIFILLLTSITEPTFLCLTLQFDL